jgi:DNA-directed RNA polymerase subunit F
MNILDRLTNEGVHVSKEEIDRILDLYEKYRD